MQGLADGYFIIPYTIGNYLARQKFEKVADDHPRCRRGGGGGGGPRRSGSSASRASERSTSFHRELGKIMWDHCGMARDKKGLEHALGKIPGLREEFWKNVQRPGLAARS